VNGGHRHYYRAAEDPRRFGQIQAYSENGAPSNCPDWHKGPDQLELRYSAMSEVTWIVEWPARREFGNDLQLTKVDRCNSKKKKRGSQENLISGVCRFEGVLSRAIRRSWCEGQPPLTSTSGAHAAARSSSSQNRATISPQSERRHYQRALTSRFVCLISSIVGWDVPRCSCSSTLVYVCQWCSGVGRDNGAR
jgi:hypothetical protein